MTINIISLIIAMLAIIVGPIVSYKIASRQIKAKYIIGEKQKAISSIKEILQKILFNRSILMSHAIQYRNFAKESITEYEENTNPIFEDLILQYSRLLLALDINNTNQKKLYNSISTSIDPLEDSSPEWEKNFIQKSQDISILSKEIITEMEERILKDL